MIKDHMIVRYYDISQYPFVELIKNHFDVSELCSLHKERLDLLPIDKLSFENESKTKFHEFYYYKQRGGWPELVSTYNNFIREIIYPIIGEDFIYQYKPTFRIHLPNDQAVHKWHYDSDEDHRHPTGEINFQIAITKMIESSATWCETDIGKADYIPMNMFPGQFIQFCGNKCTHGNKNNQTNDTRISLDFRILPKRLCSSNQDSSSVTAGIKFAVGDYYKEL